MKNDVEVVKQNNRILVYKFGLSTTSCTIKIARNKVEQDLRNLGAGWLDDCKNVDRNQRTFEFSGIAQCQFDDKYDRYTGKRIAYWAARREYHAFISQLAADEIIELLNAAKNIRSHMAQSNLKMSMIAKTIWATIDEEKKLHGLLNR